MDESEKIYCFTLLFFESERYNKNFPDAREIIIRILENFSIIFEQKYFFSNGYKILKIKNPIEKVDYPTIHSRFNERWKYWFYRWDIYNVKIFDQNLLMILSESKESISNLKNYKTIRDLVYQNLELLVLTLAKLIDFPDILKVDEKELLKRAIKYVNAIKNKLQDRIIILKGVVK